MLGCRSVRGREVNRNGLATCCGQRDRQDSIDQADITLCHTYIFNRYWWEWVIVKNGAMDVWSYQGRICWLSKWKQERFIDFVQGIAIDRNRDVLCRFARIESQSSGKRHIVIRWSCGLITGRIVHCYSLTASCGKS